MIGIYKITSPSGKIYIGQSVNIEKRFKQYSKLQNCNFQTKLYESLLLEKNHIFEVIEECNEENLNLIERKWQDYYNVIGENGLNCRLTTYNNKSGKLSKETKLKMSLAAKGKLKSEIHKLNLKNNGYCRTGEKHFNYGKKLSQEWKDKIGKSRSGILHSEESKLKISQNSNLQKIILELTTGVFYTPKEYSKLYNINIGTLYCRLNGQLKNDLNIIYV